jgi:hypothetical protein
MLENITTNEIEGGVMSELKKEYNHYFKSVKNYDYIDVYRVLTLFDVDDPCIAHAIKKLLCAGKRGDKDSYEDISEAIDSLKRYIEIKEEDYKCQLLAGHL